MGSISLLGRWKVHPAHPNNNPITCKRCRSGGESKGGRRCHYGKRWSQQGGEVPDRKQKGVSLHRKSRRTRQGSTNRVEKGSASERHPGKTHTIFQTPRRRFRFCFRGKIKVHAHNSAAAPRDTYTFPGSVVTAVVLEAAPRWTFDCSVRRAHKPRYLAADVAVPKITLPAE